MGGGSRGREHKYTCGWFMLMFDRHQHNTLKQLSIFFFFFFFLSEWILMLLVLYSLLFKSISFLLATDITLSYFLHLWLFFLSLLNWPALCPNYTESDISEGLDLSLFPLFVQRFTWSVANCHLCLPLS